MNRRSDPRYVQVSGYVSKDVAKQFKVACANLEVSQTDALEEAITAWLERKTNKTTKSET